MGWFGRRSHGYLAAEVHMATTLSEFSRDLVAVIKQAGAAVVQVDGRRG